MGLLLFPFKIIWFLTCIIIGLTGRLIGVLLSILVMITGGLLSATIIGGFLGVPLFILGLLLLIKSLIF